MWKTHGLGRDKESWLHLNAPEQKGWNSWEVVINSKKAGTSSVLHSSRREPCVCVCVLERVKESTRRSFHATVVLFPTEQTWRSKQNKHRRVMTQ